jgi:membrane associated rhomboid family serine protease
MPDTWDFSQSRPRQSDPLAQVPILTYLLVALSVIITGASMLGGSQSSSLVSAIATFGYATPEQIWSGHIWGLVTPIFIHGGVVHLLFDMLWLVQLGRILERTLPPAIYLLFIIASAAVGSTTEMLVSGQTGIGMSGVVYALFGLMWAGRGAFSSWRAVATQENLRLFVLWGLFCVATTYLPFLHFLGLNIANGAHGGGFLFGLCVGFLFYSPRRRYVWAAPLALLLAASVLACTWQPWSGDWTFWKGNREFDRKKYASAIRWYKASLRHGGDPHDNWYNISLAWNHLATDDAGRNDLTGEAEAISQYQSAAQKAGPGE